nr:MAG TPA: hypothetical protein [Caudoviricetes sp.]
MASTSAHRASGKLRCFNIVGTPQLYSLVQI